MNDNSKNKASGFTIVEILVAVFIISIGVLALSQMEILSLRQYQLAEQGTIATNIIQFISDRDVAEVKRRTLLNNEVYLDYLNARDADFDYCNGTEKICSACPCDPFTAITANTNNGDEDATCASVDLSDLDPINLTFSTDVTDCDSGDFIVLKLASTSVITSLGSPDIVQIDMKYAVKSRKQFADTGIAVSNFTIRDTIAIQDFRFSASVSDYSGIVTGASVIGNWGTVRVAHVP